MIEYLEGLLEEGHHEQEVLRLADDLLRRRSNTPRDSLAIQTAILRARATSGQYDIAVAFGKAVIQTSAEINEWDYFGIACLFVGTSYGMLGQYEEACEYLGEYIQHLPLLEVALRYQTHAWYNLGLFSRGMNKMAEASYAFGKAVETSSSMKNERREYGMHQALIVQLLRSGELSRIPRLMTKCNRFLRHHAGPETSSSYLFHTESRVRYALATARYHRATYLALRGLIVAQGDNRHLATLHLLVAEAVWELSSYDSSIDHAFAARAFARMSNRNDLENESTSFLSSAMDCSPQMAARIQAGLSE